jgi:hypothetical protein
MRIFRGMPLINDKAANYYYGDLVWVIPYGVEYEI